MSNTTTTTSVTDLTEWSCTKCTLSDNPKSKCEMCSKKKRIIDLVSDLNEDGEYINPFMVKIMNYFDNINKNKNIEMKQNVNDERKMQPNEQKQQQPFDNDKHFVSLLMQPNKTKMCQKGHSIGTHKNLENNKCIECGVRNYGYNKNYKVPNQNQIETFLDSYDTTQIPYGPPEEWKKNYKNWEKKGHAKRYPLHFAAYTGDVNEIRTLCEMKDVNVEEKRADDYNTKPLCYAAWYNHLPAVIELIKNGSNAFLVPAKDNTTPFSLAVKYKCKAVIAFYEAFTEFMTGIKINDNMNVCCLTCFQYSLKYNKYGGTNSMEDFTYCQSCAKENVKIVQLKKENNLIIQKWVRKVLKWNTNVSVDTLCEMHDAKALHSLLKEVVSSGYCGNYSLWLLDLDHFKQATTHEGANQKLILMSKVLTQLQSKTKKQWNDMGIKIHRLWVFRECCDEFGIVVHGYHMKEATQQKLYDIIKKEISRIKIENMENKKHLTISVGVCLGYKIKDYEYMMEKADTAAEIVKENGGDNIRIWFESTGKTYSDFNDIRK